MGLVCKAHRAGPVPAPWIQRTTSVVFRGARSGSPSWCLLPWPPKGWAVDGGQRALGPSRDAGLRHGHARLVAFGQEPEGAETGWSRVSEAQSR